jgi:2-dehydro-3-deoxygluconokinase
MHDLVTLGEVMLRLSVPSPDRFDTARMLDVQIGGAEANVAAVAARLGARAAWISAVPQNPWGERVCRELTGHGVDCAGVRFVPDARLGVYFLEPGVPPRPLRILYDRHDSAFTRLTPEAVDWVPVRHARIVHLTGITPALGANPRRLVERALDEAVTASFDVNYRATLWSAGAARAFVESVLPRLRYLFLGVAEARTLFELTGTAESAIEVLAQRTPSATIALLQGEDGCVVFDQGRLIRPRLRPRVQVVDPIGAGDAFVGGFLWATLSGRKIEDVVDVATAVAALKCSTWGDVALIRPRDVDDLLAGGPDVRR